jgi:preprotein translocase subunit SecE
MAKAVAVADEQSTGMERFKAQPERLITFLKDVRAEMRKVVAPSRAEVQATTTVVIVTVFIFAGYFALVDFVVGNGVTQLIHHFTTPH